MTPGEDPESEEGEEEGYFDEDADDESESDYDRFHCFFSEPCDACTFLCSVIIDGAEYDLWVHHGNGPATVFARYGEEDGQNLAGASLGEALRLTLPELPEDHQALRIAWLIANDLGLLN